MISPDAALLTDKVVVVTGAAQGIGKAAAIGMANFGADLAICDRKPELEGTAEEIRALGRRVVTGFFDVRDADAVASHLDDVKGEFGRVDVLVNNAGGGFVSPFLDVSAKGTQALVDENYTQVLHFIRGCAPLFPDTGGSIINITSVEAHRAAPGFAIYASMKAAVEQLTRSLALELSDRLIRVNCISVDAIATEGDLALADAVQGGAENYEIPWPRYGQPDDMAGPIVFLASELSAFVTGSTVQVTGGTDAARGWRRDGKGGWRP
jgi:NAD(P)-dependent dehydrogenase (short-subunit alcohol dehydrogenase family)